MAEVVKLVCDHCTSQEKVTRYWVSSEKRGRGKTTQVDLCQEHGAEIEELMNVGMNAPSVRKSRPSARRTISASKIHTQEEIDAIEAEAKK